MTSCRCRSALRAAVVSAALLLSATAHAGRPLQTEDAGVLDRGDCELELALGRERGDAPSVRTASAQFGCGIGLRTQVAAVVERARADGGRAEAAGLAGKTALRPLTDGETGIALAWSFGYTRLPGERFERDASEVRAVLTHPAGAWLLHANLGWSRSALDRSDTTVWGAAVERTNLGPVDAMVELFGAGGEKAWASAGVRWHVVPERVFLDASWGRPLRGGGASRATVGAKFAF